MAFAEGKKVKANKLVKQAPELIPDLVEDLNHFAKSQMPGLSSGFPFAANMTSAPVGVVTKAGRNDPCPAGPARSSRNAVSRNVPIQ